MKKSALIHAVSIVAGILGAVALVGAWIAGDGRTAFGLSQAYRRAGLQGQPSLLKIRVHSRV